MALLDCAINKKCCTVDGGRGICPLFSSPPRGICRFKSPHPREFAIQGQKMLIPGDQPGGGAWAQVELTDAKWLNLFSWLAKCRLVFFAGKKGKKETFLARDMHFW